MAYHYIVKLNFMVIPVKSQQQNNYNTPNLFI